MGNTIASFFQEEDEEEEEQERLKKWRPEGASQHRAAKKKAQAQDDDSDVSGQMTDDGDADSSAHGDGDESSAGEATPRSGGGDDVKSKGSDKGKESSDDSDVEDAAAQAQVQELLTTKQKFVVKMEFEPLLSLQEALENEVDEPAKLWETSKASKKTQRAEQAAVEAVQSAHRAKAKLLADWMAEMELEECTLIEASVALNMDSSELRYAITSCKRFEVNEEDLVKKTLLLRVLECMESDIETVKEVLDKLVVYDIDANDLKASVEASGGELRFKEANGVKLLERVDIQAEMKIQRALEKEKKLQEKEAKQKAKARRARRKKQDDEGSDESSSSSEDDNDVKTALNREAEKKALAFRRLQVQRKIEEFLNLYTRGQNLQKINSSGQRYNRRVYVDTNRKALVIQGASGPRFFPFVNMKEIDIDTHTSKEGQLETQVICAMEKAGRIYKELILCFADQQKASTFVNCLTLFSQALRAAAAAGKQ